MENRSREKQRLPKSLLISFSEELKKRNVDIKIRGGDEAEIEWQLWKDKEILSQTLIRASSQFKKFLLLFEKEGKVCWYNGNLDRVAVNFYYQVDSPKFEEALQIAGRLAQQLSPGIQEFIQEFRKSKNQGDIPK